MSIGNHGFLRTSHASDEEQNNSRAIFFVRVVTSDSSKLRNINYQETAELFAVQCRFIRLVFTYSARVAGCQDVSSRLALFSRRSSRLGVAVTIFT